jgi:heme A synthase
MIPLIYFLIAWLVFLAIFLILAVISIRQMLKYGLKHPVTEITTAAFVLITVLVVLGTMGYLSGVDLKAGLDLNSMFNLGKTPLF